MKERLLKVADYYGFSIRRFEAECGLLRGNISNMQENAAIGSDKLAKIIARFSNLDTNWLITGLGEMIKSPNSSAKEPVLPFVSPSEGIPLIPIEALAGFGKGEFQVMEHECERYVVPMFRGADFLISVKGSSMIPKYNSGDVVACKNLPLSDIFFQWNKVYVLDTIQGALVKRIKPGTDAEHILIVSDNPQYESFELHRSQIHAVALVVGVIRME